MTISGDIERSQKETEKWLDIQRDKEGDYTSDECPNCSRHRVMMGEDKKRRCEKCSWCIEDNGYDSDFSTFMRGGTN